MVDPAQPISRILIVRPSALGDVARTVPALASLRAAYPKAHIDWLVRDTFADAIAHHPALNGIIPFPRKAYARFGKSIGVTRQVFSFLDSLKARRYDLVFDLQGLIRSGIFTWATHAPIRCGFSNARELAWLAYNHRHKPQSAHTVDRMLDLLASRGIAIERDMRLYPSNAARDWAQRWLAARGLDQQPFAILAPTAMWRSKQWPIDRFSAIADRLADWNLHAAIVVGSPDEIDDTRPLFTHATRVVRHDAVGQTSVAQLMALIERADLTIANDSAPLHLAVGLGRRALGIFGPTDPQKVGPYRYPQGFVLATDRGAVNYRAEKDDQSLISRIGVQQVHQALDQVIQSPPPVTLWKD